MPIERIACSVTCVRWADFRKRSGKRSNLGGNQIRSTARAVIPTYRPHHGNARPRSLCPERPGPFPLELAAQRELGPNNRRLIFTVPHTEFPEQHQGRRPHHRAGRLYSHPRLQGAGLVKSLRRRILRLSSRPVIRTRSQKGPPASSRWRAFLMAPEKLVLQMSLDVLGAALTLGG